MMHFRDKKTKRILSGILVVLIVLVVIFKNQLTKLVNNIFKKITNQSKGI